MNKLKIAVIGVGGISVSHINAYLGNPDVELYAFCDINEKRLKERSSEKGNRKNMVALFYMMWYIF